jgi:hypothetical protein
LVIAFGLIDRSYAEVGDRFLEGVAFAHAGAEQHRVGVKASRYAEPASSICSEFYPIHHAFAAELRNDPKRPCGISSRLLLSNREQDLNTVSQVMVCRRLASVSSFEPKEMDIATARNGSFRCSIIELDQSPIRHERSGARRCDRIQLKPNIERKSK